LEKLLIVSMWLVFVLLLVYTAFTRIHPVWIKKNNGTIRKTWYLIFILGCLIFITINPHSLLSEWKNYLVVFVAFIIVDSMLFLNLYFSQIGGQQLSQAEQAVDVTQDTLDQTKRKLANLADVLNSFAFPQYTLTEEEYIQDFEDFIFQYAVKESLSVDVLPYATEEEKSQAVEGTPEKKVHRILDLRRTYYHPTDKLMLQPFEIHQKEYVVRVSAGEDSKVTDTDAQVINTLYVVYSMMVGNQDNEGGGNDANE
jgi:stage II sporulation protein SA